MANGFGFPKYPQKKSPNPKMVGELLAKANEPEPPQMGGPLPGASVAPHAGGALRGSPSGMPAQEVASHSLSPSLGLRK